MNYPFFKAFVIILSRFKAHYNMKNLNQQQCSWNINKINNTFSFSQISACRKKVFLSLTHPVYEVSIQQSEDAECALKTILQISEGLRVYTR